MAAKSIYCTVIGAKQARKTRLSQGVRTRTAKGADCEYQVTLWDTPSIDTCEPLAPIYVDRKQVVIYAFSIVRPETLDRIRDYYVRGISAEQKTKPGILVGLDKDLLEQDKRSEWEDGMEEIPRERINEVACAISAVEYTEWIDGDDESDAALMDKIVRWGAPYARERRVTHESSEKTSGSWCEVA